MRPSLVFSLLVLSAAATSSAQTTLYGTSFEAPTYVAGKTVGGTDGWIVGSGGADPILVSGALAHDGAQGLRFASVNFNAWSSAGRALPSIPGDGAFSVSVDLFMAAGTAATRTYELALMSTATGNMSTSTFSFGMSISGDTGTGTGAGRIRAGKTWSSLYTTNAYVATATAGSYTDRWLNIKLDVDANRNGVATISGFADGKVYAYSFTGIGATAGVNLLGDNTGGFGGAGTGTFDNFRVTSPVPEPASLAALGLGAAAFLRRRRNG